MKDELQFSYSVSYFSWAVSSSEDEDEDEEEVRNVTLPLKNLKIHHNFPKRKS